MRISFLCHRQRNRTSSPRAAAKVIADVVIRHENTRVITALAQERSGTVGARTLPRTGGRHHPSPGKLLNHLNITATEEQSYLLRALSVGLAVVDRILAVVTSPGITAA